MFYNSIITTNTALIASGVSFAAGFFVNPYIVNSNMFKSFKSKLYINKNNMSKSLDDVKTDANDIVKDVKEIVSDKKNDVKKDMKVMTERWFK